MIEVEVKEQAVVVKRTASIIHVLTMKQSLES